MSIKKLGAAADINRPRRLLSLEESKYGSCKWSTQFGVVDIYVFEWPVLVYFDGSDHRW